jgi:hypothetical protein
MSGDIQMNVSRPPAKHSIHFKVPALMIGTLLVGTFLALGQHLFYKSLDGHPIPSQEKQAWNGRYGIAITLLVKAFLNTPIGISCVQNTWWLLRSRSTRLETVDSTFGILGSALKLADFRV